MNQRIKNLLWAGVMILFFSACGQANTVPTLTPEVIDSVTNDSTSTPELMETPFMADAGKFDQYIGLNYPPLPAGLTQGISLLIQDKQGYGLSLVSVGADKMLWLGKIDHYDADGSAYWVVKDVLDLSNMGSGLDLLPDGCLLHNVPDSEIFVIGSNGAIRQAWRANTAKDQFEILPISGIRCESDKSVPLN